MRPTLEPDRWARVEELFAAALEHPVDQRAAFLDGACGDDHALREEVEGLLVSADRGMTARFDVVDRLADDLMASTGATGVGRRLGPWSLDAELGRGGMGVVYRGVRADGDFRQTVAVKVLPGALFSPEAMQRFRNERRILAGLEHPNIARLLDGGTTPEGVPYVIMEHVDGKPVDRFCEEGGVDLEGRVWLFLAVCDAVQYAHRNLVVHRDIKPSNILVTPEGVPKLLDFGIAKLVDPDDAAGQPAEARTETRIMTPRFASPEQLAGGRIGTPSDVYSLGLVLHRLLAGTDPRSRGADPGAPVSEQERIRMTLEDEPALPSAASGRPELRGDLDTIVLKALRRDVEERYESVAALADDLRRYLTGRPITARAPTWRYRAGKFVGRNRGAVSGAAVALLLLLGQTGVFLARLAGERDVARQEAARASQTLEFLTEVFRGADPWVSAATDLSASELLSQGMARMEDELAGQPSVQAEILSVVGAVYSNLGALDSARSAFERSVALRSATFGPRAAETALGISQLGGLMVELDEVERADSLLRRSLAIRRAALPANHADIAVDLGQLALLAHRSGRLAESDSLYRAALTVMDDPVEPREELRGTLLSNRGLLLLEMDRLEEATSTLEEALALRRSLHGDRHPDVGVTLSHLGRVRGAAGEHAEAEAIFRELLAWGPEVLGDDHLMVDTWKNNLSAVLKDLGRREEALELQEDVVRGWRAQYGDVHGQVATALNNLANLHAELGRLAEAEAALEEALAINRSLYGDDHPSVATNLNNLATMAWRRGDFTRAARMQEQVLEMDRRLLGPEHEYVATDLTAVGNHYLYAGRLQEAGAALRAGWDLMRDVRDEDHPAVANAAAAYADWLVAVGRGEEAEPLAREALRVRLESFDEDNLDVALSRSTLGAALGALGHYEEAESELLRADEVMRAQLREDDPTRVRNGERLGALYRAWGREGPLSLRYQAPARSHAPPAPGSSPRGAP